LNHGVRMKRTKFNFKKKNGRSLFTPYKIRKRKFKRILGGLSNKARMNLVYMPYSDNPMTVNVLWLEIMNDTKLGKKLLKEIIKNAD